MKRIIAIILVCTCVFALCACGSSSQSSTTTTDDKKAGSTTSAIFVDILPGQLISEARSLYDGKEGYETTENEVLGSHIYTVDAVDEKHGFSYFGYTGTKLGITYDITKGRIIDVNCNIYHEGKHGDEVSAIQTDILSRLEAYGAPFSSEINDKQEIYHYLVKVKGNVYDLQFTTYWGPEKPEADYETSRTSFLLSLPDEQNVTTTQAEEPVATPEPTPEPVSEPTGKLNIPDEIPETFVYEGSGDSVIKIDHPDSIWVLYVKGNAESHHFAVKGYDSNGDYTELFVNTTDPYEGVTIDIDQETVTLEITSSGNWHIEVRSIWTCEIVDELKTITGTGDSIILINIDTTTAQIEGNQGNHHFAVWSYGQKSNLMVNTTDAYSGTVMMKGDPILLRIIAVGDWNIEFD